MVARRRLFALSCFVERMAIRVWIRDIGFRHIEYEEAYSSAPFIALIVCRHDDGGGRISIVPGVTCKYHKTQPVVSSR